MRSSSISGSLYEWLQGSLGVAPRHAVVEVALHYRECGWVAHRPITHTSRYATFPLTIFPPRALRASLRPMRAFGRKTAARQAEALPRPGRSPERASAEAKGGAAAASAAIRTRPPRRTRFASAPRRSRRAGGLGVVEAVERAFAHLRAHPTEEAELRRATRMTGSRAGLTEPTTAANPTRARERRACRAASRPGAFALAPDHARLYVPRRNHRR
jgi:hypothetical protein